MYSDVAYVDGRLFTQNKSFCQSFEKQIKKPVFKTPVSSKLLNCFTKGWEVASAKYVKVRHRLELFRYIGNIAAGTLEIDSDNKVGTMTAHGFQSINIHYKFEKK